MGQLQLDGAGTVGTTHYIAPESLAHGTYSYASDASTFGRTVEYHVERVEDQNDSTDRSLPHSFGRLLVRLYHIHRPTGSRTLVLLAF